MSSQIPAELLDRLRAGDADAMGELLQQYRPYLRILADRGLDPLLSSRLSGSDVVQQTCLEALRDIQQFRGQSAEEFGVWLTQILKHNLSEITQTHILAQKRSVRREQPRDDSNAPQSLQQLEATDLSSPSSRAMRGENAIKLAQLMGKLPEDQFTAVRLRYIEDRSVSEISVYMNRTESAVGGLLKRGLQGLRIQLAQRGDE